MNENTLNLLKRAWLFVEDADFDKAEEFFERALDADAECAEAYFGMLLCDRCCKSKDELIDLAVPVDNDRNFKLAVRFADGSLRDEYSDISALIKESAEKKALICAQNRDYQIALSRLESVGSDKSECAELCRLAILTCGFKSLDISVVREYNSKADTFASSLLSDDIKELFVKENEAYIAYIKSVQDETERKRKETEAEQARQKQIKERQELLAAEKKRREAEEKRKREEKKEAERQQREERAREEAKAEKKKKILIISVAAVIVVALFGFMVLYIAVIDPKNKYETAIELFEDQNYLEAAKRFEKLEDYKDSPEFAEQANYLYAETCLANKEYETAMKHYEKAVGYQDGKDKYVQSHKLFLASTGNYKEIVAQYLDTELTILDGTTVIGGYALSGLDSLTTLYIPSSVVKIDWGAFQGCSSLVNIYYDGTAEQWNRISKSFYWNYATGEYKVYCTDKVLDKT